MQTWTDPDAFARHVRANLPRVSVVGIDGWTGVGKTTLATNLAKAAGGQCLDLDEFLERDRKRYVGAIRLDELRSSLSTSARPLFISGICIREVLTEVGLTPDLNVYVKRMASWGWADEDELDGDVIPEVNQSGGAAGLRREMRAYHRRWQPHLVADCEFHIVAG